LAEEAVSSEPVSKIPEFPANREINREKHRNPGICGRTRPQTPIQDKGLQPFSLLDPNREFFSTNREIFPVNREIPSRTENLGSERMEWVSLFEDLRRAALVPLSKRDS
jgi:hypothetical protein